MTQWTSQNIYSSWKLCSSWNLFRNLGICGSFGVINEISAIWIFVFHSLEASKWINRCIESMSYAYISSRKKCHVVSIVGGIPNSWRASVRSPHTLRTTCSPYFSSSWRNSCIWTSHGRHPNAIVLAEMQNGCSMPPIFSTKTRQVNGPCAMVLRAAACPRPGITAHVEVARSIFWVHVFGSLNRTCSMIAI